MTYSDEDVRRHLKLGEDSDWEFKEVIFKDNQPDSPKRGDWANEIAAFANTDGGVILCSVNDDGQVQGMSRQEVDELVKLLDGVCNDSIKPPVSVRIRRMEPEENGMILVVEVQQGYALHSSSHGLYYCRRGSSKRRMNSDEALRLAQQRGQARFQWFDKQPVPNTGFGTLDKALWEDWLSKEGAANPKAALERLALLTTDENGATRATVAGVLLCSQRPDKWLPSAYIQATCYHGEDRSSDQINDQDITGPLDRQIAAAMNFVTNNMAEAARKDPERVNFPQYSERAVFEALVNAVVHRDYTIHGSQTRLSIFASRLELQSPGNLPNSLTIEDLGLRVATRNRALVDMLKRMPAPDIPGSGQRKFLMESRGDGVQTIQKETEQLCGQKPDYKLIGGTDLCLTLSAAPHQQNPTQPTIT